MPSAYEKVLRYYHCYIFLWSVLSLVVCSADIPIDQFNSCTAVINKKIISLQPLAKRNGPRIFTVYNSWNYSFNPCFSFDEPENPHEGFGDQCLSVLVCKFREENNRKFYYTLGFQAGAKFQASVGEDGNTTVALIYQGYRSFRHRKTFVTLVCDRNRTKDEDALFVIKEDKGRGNIEAELHHLCSCIDGCPNVTLTQVTSVTRPQEELIDLDSKRDPGVDVGNTSIIRNAHRMSWNEMETDNNENISNNLSPEIAASFHSDMEDEDIEGFSDIGDEASKSEMDGEVRAKADKTKVLIIVGVNIGVIMLGGIVGIMCYTKKTHLKIYRKLPGLQTVPENSIWQLASMGDLADRGGKIASIDGNSQSCAYRDYEPDLNEKARKRSIFVPLLEESVIEENSLQLGQRLGGGIFGDTYIAEWTEIQVTVKRITLSVHENQLSTEFLKWMKDEVWLLSRQRHRNIVSIIGLCLESRHPYVISEYVDGQCVKDFIKRGGGLLNWPLRVKLLSQIADGMAFLHSTKPPILHRDLRCANLFITERDIVKVGDFGLIHLTQPLRSACREEDCCCQGKYSACPPSIAWTAPEVFAHPNSNESDGFITKAADVYSFGIVMWEIVMCEDPFDEIGTTKEVIEHVLSGGRPEIAGNAVILPQYKTLMQSCWDGDPENRPTFKQICVRMKELLFQARSFQKSIYNRRLKLQKDLSVKISRDSTSEPLNNTSSELP